MSSREFPMQICLFSDTPASLFWVIHEKEKVGEMNESLSYQSKRGFSEQRQELTRYKGAVSEAIWSCFLCFHLQVEW